MQHQKLVNLFGIAYVCIQSFDKHKMTASNNL